MHPSARSITGIHTLATATGSPSFFQFPAVATSISHVLEHLSLSALSVDGHQHLGVVPILAGEPQRVVRIRKQVAPVGEVLLASLFSLSVPASMLQVAQWNLGTH